MRLSKGISAAYSPSREVEHKRRAVEQFKDAALAATVLSYEAHSPRVLGEIDVHLREVAPPIDVDAAKSHRSFVAAVSLAQGRVVGSGGHIADSEAFLIPLRIGITV